MSSLSPQAVKAAARAATAVTKPPSPLNKATFDIGAVSGGASSPPRGLGALSPADAGLKNLPPLDLGERLVTIPSNSGVRARIISVEPAPAETPKTPPQKLTREETAFAYMSRLNQEMPVKTPLSETFRGLVSNPLQKAEIAIYALPGIVAGAAVETVRKMTKGVDDRD